jgi:adenine-specific DNA methylase
LATLLPDPGDSDKRQALLDLIGGTVVTKDVKTVDDDGVGHTEEKETLEGGVLAWGREGSADMDALRAKIRECFGDKAPKVLDPFAGGGAIPLEAMRLGCDVTASDINPVAWFILKCTLEYPHRFAGKKWPLPDFVKEWPNFLEDFRTGKVKKRKGKTSLPFIDPIQGRLFDLPDADLAWHVRAWGRWVLERARADLTSRYPVVNGEPTVAYLWARTARDKMEPYGRIPLLKTFWLCKKKGRRAAIMPVPKADGSGVDFRLLDEKFFSQELQKLHEEYPHLKAWEVGEDDLTEFLNKGTMNRAGVWSPCTGRPGLIALTMEDLRRQGQQGLLGTQMTAVVVEATKPGKKTTFKKYRLPEERELKAAEVETEDLEAVFQDIPFGIPDEPLPPVGTLGFRIPLYGFKKWSDIFTPRQLLALGVFVKHTRKAIQEIAKSDRPESTTEAEAVGAYLQLNFDRLLSFSCSNVRWKMDAEAVVDVFARFALPMLWDFAEAIPVGEYAGAYSLCYQRIGLALDSLIRLGGTRSPELRHESAIAISKAGYSLVFTDPPYYDAIPYSDLMDYFHVWLRRVRHGIVAFVDDPFGQALSPKWDHQRQDGELIDDESRFGGDKKASKKAYEDGMAKAFQSCCNSLREHGRLVVVFANKEVDAWETLIAALIRGGAVVTASWPIETEMRTRTRSMSSAALASSVWIVCRKRDTFTQPGWEEAVLDEMRGKLFEPRESLGQRNILQYYFDLGIRGPDFIWAALGPALEAYSAHPYVKKPAGGIMTVPEFLKEVRRLVLHFSLGELPGFREIQQTTQGRGEGIELDSVTQYYLLHRAFFGLDPTPAGACILYANACGKNETELKVVWNIIEQGGKSKRGRPSKSDGENADDSDDETEGKGNEYRLLRWQERTRREGLGEARGGMMPPLIDRLHRLMFLFQQNRASEVQQAFDNWGLANDRAFAPLLQAVRELALRDKDDTEKRLVEALAVQLKMTKRTVNAGEEPHW